MVNKNILLLIVVVFLVVAGEGVSAAIKVFDYGFEDWGGSIELTPGYIFTTTYTEYCINHANATEVIISYNADEMGQTWTPHSGSYFWLQDDSPDYVLDPAIGGITLGRLDAHNNIGLGSGICGDISLNIGSAIITGEIFIRFWARMNQGFSTVEGATPGCKWIFVETDTGTGVYMHLSTSSYDVIDGVSPLMFFYHSPEGGVLDRIRITNAYDGNWHKYSFYINFNTGLISAWYDVDNENLGNPTMSWQAPDGQISGCTKALYFKIQGNFAARYPTEETYHALDDIEVWDGVPTSTTECNNSIDDDLDGDIDMLDTGCSSLIDNDETNCGDLVCEGGETCLTCVSDCPINAGEVCCAGTIYTGDCCDDSDCVSPETCVSYVCTLTSTCSSADSDTSGDVSITEVMNYITQWKAGSVTITELMTGIGEWKNGC